MNNLKDCIRAIFIIFKRSWNLKVLNLEVDAFGESKISGKISWVNRFFILFSLIFILFGILVLFLPRLRPNPEIFDWNWYAYIEFGLFFLLINLQQQFSNYLEENKLKNCLTRENKNQPEFNTYRKVEKLYRISSNIIIILFFIIIVNIICWIIF